MIVKRALFNNYLAAASCAAAFAITVGTLIGCSRPTSAPTRAHVMVGFDTSKGDRQLLASAVLATTRLTRQLQLDRDRLTLFRMDRETREFFDQEVPHSTRALQRTIVSAVEDAPRVSGTFPTKFWSITANRAAQDEQPTAVILFSDGDNDATPDATGTLRAAAQKLAANPNVAVVAVYGALPTNWAWLRDCFQPLGDRFRLAGPTDLNVGPLADRLQRARGRKE
jgi:hypothetical protein